MAQDYLMTGNILDERIHYTIQEISVICGTQTTTIVELIEHGIIEPDISDSLTPQFSYKQVRRSQLALTLVRDLEVDINGLGLSLDLLEEVQQLRQEVAILERLLNYRG